MTDTMGEIRLFGGNFAMKNWAFCNGQLLPISQYQTLFSLLGTTYGGDGRTTFGLPDLRGRTAIGAGVSDFGTKYKLGQRGGVQVVTLTTAQIPPHTHDILMNTIHAYTALPLLNDEARGAEPDGTGYAIPSNEQEIYNTSPNNLMGVAMGTFDADIEMLNDGGSQYHLNLQPYLGLQYIICITGIFPSRS